MKDFNMSMYKSKADLYMAKAEYYEALFNLCVNRLIQEGILIAVEEGYACTEDGLLLDVLLKYGDSL